jgi:putative DNA primase/helicase
MEIITKNDQSYKNYIQKSDIERAIEALSQIPCPLDENTWQRCAKSLCAIGLNFEYFHEWSKTGSNYKSENECRTKWKWDRGITAGTFFKYAKENGYKTLYRKKSPEIIQFSPATIPYVAKENIAARKIWDKCAEIEEHPYISRKNGITNGLKLMTSSLIIDNQDVKGSLAVPLWENGFLQNIQFIPQDPSQKKLNLAAPLNNGYFSIEGSGNKIFISEGIGQAWTVFAATGCTSVVSFSAGRIRNVTKTLREKNPNGKLIIVADKGQEELCRKISKEFNTEVVTLPEEMKKNDDINDYEKEKGIEEVKKLILKPKYEYPLSIVFADELPDEIEPADELVEDLLLSKSGSILYGDSNSGKTFFVIDLACAIARGSTWMGKRTQKGMVVYLAVESVASVKRRLQIYQKFHKVKVPNFVIVQNPINLFNGDEDTNKIIDLIKILEEERGEKVKFVVGDTLARLSSGANENAGTDMGVVIKHFDKIINECEVAFNLIHHCGKNAANGARGWSGVRAAVDTEIEVTECGEIKGAEIKCAEITKQRDLNSKGLRIGFKLETIEIGKTSWGNTSTSRIVFETDAPAKKEGKKINEVGGAISEYLLSNPNLIRRADLAKHLKDRYHRSGVYKEIKKLILNGKVVEEEGFLKYVP